MTDEELQAKFLYDNGTLRNKFAIKNADELSLIEYRGVAERDRKSTRLNSSHTS